MFTVETIKCLVSRYLDEAYIVTSFDGVNIKLYNLEFDEVARMDVEELCGLCDDVLELRGKKPFWTKLLEFELAA